MINTLPAYISGHGAESEASGGWQVESPQEKEQRMAEVLKRFRHTLKSYLQAFRKQEQRTNAGQLEELPSTTEIFWALNNSRQEHQENLYQLIDVAIKLKAYFQGREKKLKLVSKESPYVKNIFNKISALVSAMRLLESKIFADLDGKVAVKEEGSSWLRKEYDKAQLFLALIVAFALINLQLNAVAEAADGVENDYSNLSTDEIDAIEALMARCPEVEETQVTTALNLVSGLAASFRAEFAENFEALQPDLEAVVNQHCDDMGLPRTLQQEIMLEVYRLMGVGNSIGRETKKIETAASISSDTVQSAMILETTDGVLAFNQSGQMTNKPANKYRFGVTQDRTAILEKFDSDEITFNEQGIATITIEGKTFLIASPSLVTNEFGLIPEKGVRSIEPVAGESARQEQVSISIGSLDVTAYDIGSGDTETVNASQADLQSWGILSEVENGVAGLLNAGIPTEVFIDENGKLNLEMQVWINVSETGQTVETAIQNDPLILLKLKHDVITKDNILFIANDVVAVILGDSEKLGTSYFIPAGQTLDILKTVSTIEADFYDITFQTHPTQPALMIMHNEQVIGFVNLAAMHRNGVFDNRTVVAFAEGLNFKAGEVTPLFDADGNIIEISTPEEKYSVEFDSKGTGLAKKIEAVAPTSGVINADTRLFDQNGNVMGWLTKNSGMAVELDLSKESIEVGGVEMVAVVTADGRTGFIEAASITFDGESGSTTGSAGNSVDVTPIGAPEPNLTSGEGGDNGNESGALMQQAQESINSFVEAIGVPFYLDSLTQPQIVLTPDGKIVITTAFNPDSNNPRFVYENGWVDANPEQTIFEKRALVTIDSTEFMTYLFERHASWSNEFSCFTWKNDKGETRYWGPGLGRYYYEDLLPGESSIITNIKTSNFEEGISGTRVRLFISVQNKNYDSIMNIVSSMPNFTEDDIDLFLNELTKNNGLPNIGNGNTINVFISEENNANTTFGRNDELMKTVVKGENAYGFSFLDQDTFMVNSSSKQDNAASVVVGSVYNMLFAIIDSSNGTQDLSLAESNLVPSIYSESTKALQSRTGYGLPLGVGIK